ncbi:MAG: alpha/beta hydrolase [Aliishimia sp.]
MAELDEAYANGDFIADAASFPPRWQSAAAAFRDRLSAQGRAVLHEPYGESDRQAFDLFLPTGTPKGLMIFVHGGYWLMFDRSYWSHLGQGAIEQGWAVGMPSYDLCPEVSIADITQQIAHAVKEMAARVDGPVTLAGHSAGGHLVSRMLEPGVLDAHVAKRVSHVVPISPVADLRPLLKTSMNAKFELDQASAWAESPVRQPAPQVQVTVWVGEKERPVFLEQSRWLAQAWGCEHVVAPGKHHFDVIDALADPHSDIVHCLTP